MDNCISVWQVKLKITQVSLIETESHNSVWNRNSCFIISYETESQ